MGCRMNSGHQIGEGVRWIFCSLFQLCASVPLWLTDFSKTKYPIGALLAIAMMSGCTTTTPRLDQHFGEAVNIAKAQQTINPDASRNTDPVAGLDGKDAKSTIDRYHATFQTPPAPVNVFAIGVGSGGGNGAR